MTVQPRVDVLVDSGPTPLDKQWDVNGTVGDVGDLTYKVETANGTVQVPTTTTTKTGTGTATLYSFDLPVQTELTRLKLTYAKASDPTQRQVHYIEVFGSQLFTERDARGSQITGAQTPFSDTAKYPDEVLAAWRLRIQDQFESKTYRSWVRRYARVRLAPNHPYRLRPFGGRAVDWEGRGLAGEGRYADIVRVISVTDSGTALDLADLVLDGEVLHLGTGYWQAPTQSLPLNVVLEYEYGVDPPDSEAHGQALAMLHANAIPNNISQAVESWSDDSGSFRVSPDGWAYPSKTWEWMNRVQLRGNLA